MRKIKILYIVSSLKKSGPTNQLYYIISNLNREKFEPVVLTLSKEPTETMRHDFEMLKIVILNYTISKPKSIFGGHKNLIKMVYSINPELIHTQGIRADRFSAKLFNEYPSVCTVRNYMFVDYPSTYGTVLGNIMAKNHLRHIRKIDCPIACSHSIKQEYYDKHNLFLNVIQNGVNIEKYNQVSIDEKEALREKLKLPFDKNIYISTGHLSSRKDPLTLIKAFKKSNCSKNGVLLFLGDGDLKEDCHKLAKNNNNILFRGRVSNVNEYLKAADVFVSASKAEGLPNAMLEGMSCNLLVCVSDIRPHLEVLQMGNYSGEYFEIGNLESCILALNKTSIGLDSKNIINNRNIIKEFLSDYKMSLNYQEKYIQMIK